MRANVVRIIFSEFPHPPKHELMWEERFSFSERQMHHYRFLKLVSSRHFYTIMLMKGFLFLLIRSVFTIPTRWRRTHLPMQKTRVRSLGGKIPWRRKWQPSPVFLPGKSHKQRSLAGYSPRGHKESDMTEQLSTHAGALNSVECKNNLLLVPTIKILFTEVMVIFTQLKLLFLNDSV